MTHSENHKSHRIGWLRAAVLGANDGILSTASLIIGVAAASTSHQGILLAGVAGLVAGAMSMAAGEYVSVSSQSDTEQADLAIEQKALDEDIDSEKAELAEIYEGRGIDPELAMEVAEQLMAHDALGAHARDEIGISENNTSKPGQAAIFSAATFTIGAALPLAVAWFAPIHFIMPLVALFSLVFLALLGGIAAIAGGASIVTGAKRVVVLGALAMALTALVGQIFGVVA